MSTAKNKKRRVCILKTAFRTREVLDLIDRHMRIAGLAVMSESLGQCVGDGDALALYMLDIELMLSEVRDNVATLERLGVDACGGVA